MIILRAKDNLVFRLALKSIQNEGRVGGLKGNKKGHNMVTHPIAHF